MPLRCGSWIREKNEFTADERTSEQINTKLYLPGLFFWSDIVGSGQVRRMSNRQPCLYLVDTTSISAERRWMSSETACV